MMKTPDRIGNFTRKTTTLLAMVLAALLITAAPLAAAPVAQQDTAEDAELTEVIENPDEFAGETITVNGYVSNVNLGDQLFILTTDTRLRLDQLLVITTSGSEQNLEMDQSVSVTGTIETYMPNAEAFADLDLNEQISESLLGRAVLLADSVELTAVDGEDDSTETATGLTVEGMGDDAEDEVPASEGITATTEITGAAGITEVANITGTTDMAGTATSENVVARIGERDITQGEFDEWFLNAVTLIAAQQGIPVNPQTTEIFAGMQEQFLQQMVREEILLAEAERRNITVTDDEIQDVIDEIRAQFDSDQAYQEAITQLGFQSEEELRNYVLVSETLQQVTEAIINDIEVTDEEVEQFYEENQDLFTVDGVVATLEEVAEVVRGELERQAFDMIITGLEEDAEVQLMAENLAPYQDEAVTTGIPAEPVDDTDEMTDTQAITGTTEITVTIGVTDTGDMTDDEMDGSEMDTSIITPTEGTIDEIDRIAPEMPVTSTIIITQSPDIEDEESNLTEPVPMTVTGTSDVRTATATLMDPDETIGSVTFTEIDDGIVQIEVILNDNHALTPGPHGIHIHETGACTPSFAAAGGHFNPTGTEHGLDNPNGSHIGDLPNIEISEFSGEYFLLSDRITLGEGETSLFDEDGSAIIIHAGEDDQMTDPSGDSGDRAACGVIEPGTNTAADALE